MNKMKTIAFYAGLYQDCFAYNLLAGSSVKKPEDPIFLDIGCYDPLFRNNTFLFEELGWRGFCFDIRNCEQEFSFSKFRTTPFVQMDTTSIDFTRLLKQHALTVAGVEFISLDVDEASLSTLDRLLDANVRFKCMCFEHDYLRIGELLRSPSREKLHSEGYEMLFPDISFSHQPTGLRFAGNFFEDWWIDPSFFPDDIMSIKEEGLRYYDAVDRLKDFMGNEYIPNYHFSHSKGTQKGDFEYKGQNKK